RGEFVGSFSRTSECANSCSDPQIPLDIQTHPITTSSRREIIDQPLVVQPSVRLNVESPDSSVAVQRGVAVHEIELLVVRSNGNAIGSLNGRLLQYPCNGAIGIDAVHALNIHFHVGSISVTGIGEIDPSLAINRQIVRTVVTLAFVSF